MKINTSYIETYDKYQQISDFNSKRPFKCKYCPRSYKYIQSFELHFNEKHMDLLKWIVPNEQCKRLNQRCNALNPPLDGLNSINSTKNTNSKSVRNFSVIIPNPNVLLHTHWNKGFTAFLNIQWYKLAI